MLSDSIKYQNQRSAKLICDPRLIPINQKNRKQADWKSLYYIPADCKSAGTLVLLVLCRLQGIVDNVMAALNIRIVDKQQD